jgi:hydrogenase maturation protease
VAIAVRRVRVIGCGNPDAGDDALGLVAARLLRNRVPEEVEVVDAGPATKVLDLLDDVETVIVVDAVREPTGARPPGTLVRAEGDGDGLPAELRGSLSSHGLGLAEAVGLAAALGDTPRVIFHGVEAGDVGVGAPLSAAIVAALPELLAAIAADVAREVSA